MEPLRKLPEVNARGHLFVLIGTDTFSAGTYNAAQSHSHNAAVLVGETIGERPNSCQEADQFLLPPSRIPALRRPR